VGGFLIHRRRGEGSDVSIAHERAAVENGEYREKRTASPADKTSRTEVETTDKQIQKKRLGSDWTPDRGEGGMREGG